MATELPRYQSSFLLAQFREFYRQLVNCKLTVEHAEPVTVGAEAAVETVVGAAAGAGGTTSGAAPALTDLRGSPDAERISQQLADVLMRQAMEAGQSGGAFAYEVYAEAQYVMAALADDIFLHVDWDGRENWPLIESRLFHSHIAGEKFFERLERLLQRNDPFYTDLAMVYFMALSLGFQGQYRGQSSLHLDHYRQRLFAMIYRRKPKLYAVSAPLFPQTYQHTMDKGAPRKLPAQWVWLWLFVLVLGLWAALAQVAWASSTSELACLICRLIPNRNCGACETGIPPSPQPSISAETGLNPAAATAGEAGVQLLITGSHFVNGAVAVWNAGALQRPLPTVFLNSTQVSATVPSELLTRPGVAFVNVQNPGGGASNAVPFTVNAGANVRRSRGGDDDDE